MFCGFIVIYSPEGARSAAFSLDPACNAVCQAAIYSLEIFSLTYYAEAWYGLSF